jgi:hypothetical protein
VDLPKSLVLSDFPADLEEFQIVSSILEFGKDTLVINDEIVRRDLFQTCKVLD